MTTIFDLGYHHVLGYTLFGNDYSPRGVPPGSWQFTPPHHGHSLKCFSSLEWLLGCLNNEFTDPIEDWDQPRYLFNGEFDVLFLDLRLWEDNDTEKRKDVIKQIFDVAESLTTQTKPADPNFKRAFEAAEETSTDPDKFSPEALTLLPLLLSHIDRTLPIVLFTSSHQRVVSEMLRGHPNIITKFVKPLVSGYGEMISPEDSMSDLEDAIKEAIRLHEARIAWKRICDLVAKDACFGYKDDTVPNPYSLNSVNVAFSGKENKICPRLAKIFETCVFGNSVYDSISKPWEFLECNFRISPTAPQNYNRILTNERGMNNWMRNSLACALKETRNAKAHCELEEDSFGDVEARQIAVLQLLFLVDFLTGNDNSLYKLHGRKKPRLAKYGIDQGPKHVLGELAKYVANLNIRNFLDVETEKAMLKLMEKHELGYIDTTVQPEIINIIQSAPPNPCTIDYIMRIKRTKADVRDLDNSYFNYLLERLVMDGTRIAKYGAGRRAIYAVI